MAFRCVRLGNLFVYRIAVQMMIPLLIVLLPSLLVIVLDAFSGWLLAALLLIAAFVVYLLIAVYPTELSFENRCFIWTEMLHMTGSNREHRSATVTVGGLHGIVFLQNGIERIFDIGRIQFMGVIRSIDCEVQVDPPDIPFITAVFADLSCSSNHSCSHYRNHRLNKRAPLYAERRCRGVSF